MATERLERLSGPSSHICWTPDHTPINEREIVVLVDYNALVKLENDYASTKGWRDIETQNFKVLQDEYKQLQQQYEDLLNASTDLIDALNAVPEALKSSSAWTHWCNHWVKPSLRKMASALGHKIKDHPIE